MGPGVHNITGLLVDWNVEIKHKHPSAMKYNIYITAFDKNQCIFINPFNS